MDAESNGMDECHILDRILERLVLMSSLGQHFVYYFRVVTSGKDLAVASDEGVSGRCLVAG